MNQIQKVEYDGMLVLTTQQIAEAYETDAKTISNNFNRNKDRYIKGKHYIYLEGEELKAFKGIHQNDESLIYASKLYLWTKKGAFLHAKSLNTDTAWEVYDRLVDDYFDKKETKTIGDKASLDSANKAAEILGSAYKLAGVDERYLALLVGSVYKECGMEFLLPPLEIKDGKLYDQTMIEKELGIVSAAGKPHAQAVGAIIGMLDISEKDKVSTPYTNNGHSGVVVQYTKNVLDMVENWINDNSCPTTIKSGSKSYKVSYV